MKKLNNILLAIGFVGVLALSFKSPSDSLTYLEEGSLSVVINGKGAPSDINMSSLKNVLKGEQQRWKDGTKIRLAFMKPTTEIGLDMTSRIFGMTGKELNKHFLAKVFQGKISSPEFFESESELLKFVAGNEGAIGIVSSSKAKYAVILNVDGKKSL